MKVARKHIVAAIENAGRLTFFPKYTIKAYSWKGQMTARTGEFGWTISVLPKNEKSARKQPKQ